MNRNQAKKGGHSWPQPNIIACLTKKIVFKEEKKRNYMTKMNANVVTL